MNEKKYILASIDYETGLTVVCSEGVNIYTEELRVKKEKELIDKAVERNKKEYEEMSKYIIYFDEVKEKLNKGDRIYKDKYPEMFKACDVFFGLSSCHSSNPTDKGWEEYHDGYGFLDKDRAIEKMERLKHHIPTLRELRYKFVPVLED